MSSALQLEKLQKKIGVQFATSDSIITIFMLAAIERISLHNK